MVGENVYTDNKIKQQSWSSIDLNDELKLGLSHKQVKLLQKQYGANSLPQKSADSLWRIFSAQFTSPFIFVLLAAAMVSLLLGQMINGIFIFLVLLLNAVIGTIQEFSAQRAAEALKNMVPETASVIRDGNVQRLPSCELVPGDRVLLASGDKVPADLKLLQVQNLFINESILTGESLAASKHAATSSPIDSHAPLSERRDQAFAATIVTRGRGQAEVIAIGADTQIGQIASNVNMSAAEKPPLLQRIERFTLRVSYAVIVVIALLFLLTLLRGEDLNSVFLLGVALAVSAIPEGLPAAITVALAIGMRRMAKKNVIVRKLVAVEALGSCTYICSDKTGTLTVNEMTATQLVLADGSRYQVSGEGLDMHGDIQNSQTGEVASLSDKGLETLVLSGLLANEASLTYHDGQWQGSGDGVDLAFLVLADKLGLDHQKAASNYHELASIPYESENAFSGSLRKKQDRNVFYAKGSAEKILSMCSVTLDGQVLNTEKVQQQLLDLASQGYRVLALACGNYEHDALVDKNPSHLTFLGLVGMIDPVRPEALEAVQNCKKAHIQVAMITGDHPQTALAIAAQLGICLPSARVVTGTDLLAAEQQGPTQFQQLIASSHVFARIEPNQKMQIVRQLIDDGHFVAVTGDGVNDAPALRHAHVGIAMGKRGTDVARESSELILTDDNFASIVDGIREGRIVYNNVRKVIFLLISTGAAEIMLFIFSVLLGQPMPLLPLQLLWLNLVTNGIQDVALAFEPAEGNELEEKPRPPKEAIFNRLMLERVFINAAVMGSLAFMIFMYCLDQGMELEAARNITLLLMVLFENVHVLNSRSETQSIFKQPFWGNPLLIGGMLTAQGIHILAMYIPGLNTILQMQPVSFEQWLSLLIIALSLIVVDESHKWLLRRNHS